MQRLEPSPGQMGKGEWVPQWAGPWGTLPAGGFEPPTQHSLEPGRSPGNFLARVQLSLKPLPQWILGRGNPEFTSRHPSLSSLRLHPALW